MKELLKKKSTQIALLLIVVAVIAIIVGMNVQSAQKEKEYNAHIEAAEKYLTELDYEQAIAEYTLALVIEPNAEEVLNGLEKTYLAYADSLADAGEYEKAIQVLNEGYAQTGRESLQEKLTQIQEMQAQAEEEATIAYADALAAAGEYDQAIQVLNEGYAQTGRASLQEKLTQIQEMQTQIEFPLDDITICGYSMESGNFEKVLSLYPTDDTGTGGIGYDASKGYYYITHDTLGTALQVQSTESSSCWWWYRYKPDGSIDLALDGRRLNEDFGPLGLKNDGQLVDFPEINVPIGLGDTYEDWCRVMPIDRIKEIGQKSARDDWDVWSFVTHDCEAEYMEHISLDTDDYFVCIISIVSVPSSSDYYDKEMPRQFRVNIGQDGRINDIVITAW
ncbi:MAG: hypothetical protein MR523_07445 [Lachnospiraceae bacterium]|nr:hypothetical protein [Lachnospiraceae bacterium]